MICFIIDGIDFAIEFFNFGLPMDPCNGSTMNGTVLSAVLGLSAIGDFILSWGCPVLIVMLVLVPNIILFGRIAELKRRPLATVPGVGAFDDCVR